MVWGGPGVTARGSWLVTVTVTAGAGAGAGGGGAIDWRDRSPTPAGTACWHRIGSGGIRSGSGWAMSHRPYRHSGLATTTHNNDNNNNTHRNEDGMQPVDCFVSDRLRKHTMIPTHANTPTCQHANMPTCQHANMPTCQHANMPTCHHAIMPSCHHAITNIHANMPKIRKMKTSKSRSSGTHHHRRCCSATAASTLCRFADSRTSLDPLVATLTGRCARQYHRTTPYLHLHHYLDHRRYYYRRLPPRHRRPASAQAHTRYLPPAVRR